VIAWHRLGLRWLALLNATACAAVPVAHDDTHIRNSAPTRYKVTMVSAGIASKAPDGEPWHRKNPSELVPIFKSLATLSRISFAAEALEALLTPDTATDIPPLPIVEVRVGDALLGSTISQPTLSPKWNWPFALDLATGDHRSDSQISFIVRDSDAGAVLAKYETSVGEILGDDERRQARKSRHSTPKRSRLIGYFRLGFAD